METKKKRRTWISWVALALTAAILAGLPVLASRREPPSNIQVSIRSAQAEKRDVGTVLVGGGQMESSGVYNLKIPETVKIQEFLVGNGDTVRAGEAIARVDSVSVMTAITQVQETLQELSAQINEADTAATTDTIRSKPSGRVKKLYGHVGDSVEDVMLQYGALAVLSLDDTMVVRINAETSLTAGDKVMVSVADNSVTGRVKSNVNGELIVTVEDNKYEIGIPVMVSTKDGEPIGSGELCVYNGWNVVAYSGTISSVNVREEQIVSENQTLFTVTESGKSADYQRAIDKRQKYETLMQELFAMYRSGVIEAPYDGIVSGIDTNGAYMLSVDTEESDFQLVLLADVSFPIQIATQSLPDGTVGAPYTVFLKAVQGDTVVSGTWAVTELPAGLSLDSASGLISGTPTVAGIFPVIVSFTVDGTTFCTAELSLTISKKSEEETPQYYGYLAQVTAAGGDVIQVKQTEYAYTISNLEQFPNATADVSAMTVDATYVGQAIVNGNFVVNDCLWIILDHYQNLVKAVKISGIPGNGVPGGGMPSGSFGGGMSGGFGGNVGGSLSREAPEEENGLYSLDKVTVATVTSQEQMTLRIAIDELDITKVFVGQTAWISMNAFAEEDVEAVVRKIANSGENSGGNSKFTVELELQKSSRMLPGMNATATFLLDMTADTLCIPVSALTELDGEIVVYTSYDAKTETLGTPVTVTIGSADADFVEILSGLRDGQTVYYETYETNSLAAIPNL